MRLALISLIFSLFARAPLYGQVAPHAKENNLPFTFGGGFSRFYTDWSGYESGPTAWLDCNFQNLPSVLDGVGVEVEGRDLNYGRTGDIPKLRESTMGGGVIYTFHQIPIPYFHFYGKYLVEFGRAYVSSPSLNISPQAVRSVIYTPGTGIEVRTWHNVWVHGEYEWQYWRTNLRDVPSGAISMSPNGFTIGLSYHLPGIHSRTR